MFTLKKVLEAMPEVTFYWAGDGPYKDKILQELEKFPKLGKKKVAVITPAFVSDCLETLEEIAMEGKEDFLEAGGTDYKHIPCMNDNDDWVDVMVNWINDWENK